MRLTSAIVLSEIPAQSLTGPLEVRWMKPPGESPARHFVSIHDRNKFQKTLDELLSPIQAEVRVGGVYSGALSGQSFAILLFVVSAVTGGFLGSIGKELWQALKKVCSAAAKRNDAKRIALEIGIEMTEHDLILHLEGSSAEEIAAMLEEVDPIYSQLQEAWARNPELFKGSRCIELRRNEKQKTYDCVRYTYRRARAMRGELP